MEADATAHDEHLRLIGARDGLVTAIIALRQEYRQYFVPAHHKRRLAERDRFNAALLRIEERLLRETHDVIKAMQSYVAR